MPTQCPARIYFAGPLFTQAEWRWNERLAEQLESHGLDVILPQRRAEPMLCGDEPFDAKLLFRENVKGIESAAVVVAILDGADPDSGTCWECGYAYKLGRPIVGVRTDIRAGGDDPEIAVNLMLSVCATVVIAAPMGERRDVAWVADRIADAVQSALTAESSVQAGAQSRGG
jgi:nucleoside 2-deoxyribosyltransferase